jgi:hypothetical protein
MASIAFGPRPHDIRAPRRLVDRREAPLRWRLMQATSSSSTGREHEGDADERPTKDPRVPLRADA